MRMKGVSCFITRNDTRAGPDIEAHTQRTEPATKPYTHIRAMHLAEAGGHDTETRRKEESFSPDKRGRNKK